MHVATVLLAEIRDRCGGTFRMPRNRNLGRNTFISRQQRQSECHTQFRNVLTGLAAECSCGDQRDNLIKVAFIQTMNNNKAVHERLFTPRKNDK